MRQSRHRFAGVWRLRSRHDIPAARSERPRPERGCSRSLHGCRRPNGTGLARCPDRQLLSRPQRSSHRTGDSPSFYQTRRQLPRRRCLRAQAVRHPQANPSRYLEPGFAGSPAILCRLAVIPHHRLQGHDPGPQHRCLLSGTARSALGIGASVGPPAVFDQHFPLLVAGAPVPLSMP